MVITLLNKIPLEGFSLLQLPGWSPPPRFHIQIYAHAYLNKLSKKQYFHNMTLSAQAVFCVLKRTVQLQDFHKELANYSPITSLIYDPKGPAPGNNQHNRRESPAFQRGGDNWRLCKHKQLVLKVFHYSSPAILMFV